MADPLSPSRLRMHVFNSRAAGLRARQAVGRSVPPLETQAEGRVRACVGYLVQVCP